MKLNVPRGGSGILLALALALTLVGCQPDPNDAFIQGDWYYWDAHLGQIMSEQDLEIWWTFIGGKYSYRACCFSEAQEDGNYRITQSEGDTLILELFNRRGQIGGINIPRDEIGELKIVINRTDDTIKINRAVFTRVNEP